MALSGCLDSIPSILKRAFGCSWSPRATWTWLWPASTTSVLVLLGAVVIALMRTSGSIRSQPTRGAAIESPSIRNSSSGVTLFSCFREEAGKSAPPLCSDSSNDSCASLLSLCEITNDSYGWMTLRKESSEYDWSQSTEINHRRVEGDKHHEGCSYRSPFLEVRASLDRQFHSEYSDDRQRFQDAVIQSMLERNRSTTYGAASEREANLASANEISQRQRLMQDSSSSNARPWIVFSAGAMGAGKTWTVKLLHEKGRFPLDQFVMVDPDTIRHELPEYQTYVKLAPDRAGDLTRKESGMIAEVLVKVALDHGRNVLVDGSLRNASWYRQYFDWLRREYKNIRIAIFHVTAPRHIILSRAARRSNETGRVVPVDLLETVITEVPRSFRQLRPHVDFAVELRNAEDDADDVELLEPKMNWLQFSELWRSA